VGFAGNSIYMAVFLLINSFLSLYFFFEDIEKERKSYKFLIFFLIFSILLFATGSRGVILSYLSSLFILLVIFSLKKYVKLNTLFRINNQKISFFILLVLIISAILTVSLRTSSLIQRIPPLRRLVSISVSDVSTINRIIVTKTSIQAFLQKPT
jgi:O-antigen ligase